MKTSQKSTQFPLSRRKFLYTAGGLTFLASTAMIVPSFLEEDEDEEGSERRGEARQISVWVHLGEDGQITIYNPASEMGQGSMTAVPVILAEEMDADWSQVRIEHAPIEPEIYGAGWDGSPGGTMITVGSRTVRSYYNYMRQSGAQARYVLLSNVARKWKVPLEELETEPSMVIHAKSKRKISYGEIARFAKSPDTLPEIPASQLKDPSQFRLIGKVMPRFDIPAKVDGSAPYSMDIQVPNMVFGLISRSPVHGAKPTLQNEPEIRQMPGVLEVVSLDHGIGIIAETLEGALEVKSQLKISWSKGAKAETFNTSEAYKEYETIAQDPTFQANMLSDTGDVKKALQIEGKTYEADYKNEAIYHAQMEPLNAVVSIADDGQSAEIWVGTQAPGRARSTVAKILGIGVDKVRFNPQYLGGGFGRRSTPDFIAETVHLAKAVSRPVKLIWTREDDLQYGMYRPMSLQRMRAQVDTQGNIQSWHHVVVGTGGGLLGSGAKTDFYAFPNQRVEVRNIDHGIRTKHWRAVGHGPNKFAIEAFLDEIAQDQKVDPVDMRLRLMKDYPRAQKVLRMVAEMANWGAPVPEGKAWGVSFAERSGSLGACICEISLDRESGKISIHRIWASLDAGLIVQPDNVKAQMEGGFIMGMSSIFHERISMKNGQVEQSNFHDYPILRIADIPESIEIELIPSAEHPTGVGESSIPLIGGAVANAFARLTGKRLRHLPFTPEKVLETLKG